MPNGINAMTDSAQIWNATLERFLHSAHFGSHIVSSQVIAAAGQQVCLLINGDTWRLSADPETQACAEVALALPMLNESVTPIFVNLWIESAGDPSNDMFRLCWRDSPAERACRLEMRNAMQDIIEDFRRAAAEIQAERGQRITEELIA